MRQLDLWRAEIVRRARARWRERKLQINPHRRSGERCPRTAAGVVTGRQASCLFTTQVDEAGGPRRRLRIPSAVARRRARAACCRSRAKATPPRRRFPPDATRLAFARYDAITRDAQLMVQELDLSSRRAALRTGAGLAAREPALARTGPRTEVTCSSSKATAGPRMDCWRRVAHRARGGRQARGLSITWRDDGPPLAVAANRDEDFDIWALPLDPETHTALGPPSLRRAIDGARLHPRLCTGRARHRISELARRRRGHLGRRCRWS